MQPRLRFQCQPGCTACCEQRGFVYLTDADLERAAAFTGMTAAEFERKYVYRTAKRMRLRTPRGKRCPFLAGGGCSIHPAKPTQCRIFPFWPEIVSSRREWIETAKYCPGMSKGPLISIRTVREQAEEMRKGYPAMYEE